MNDQAKVNFIIYSPCVTGPLSILGSLTTLLTLHRAKKKVRRTYHRLMMGISISDILFSLGFALGPLPLPKDAVPGAGHGNTATCSFQVFLIQLGSASFAYNLMLMIYYLLVIRCHVKQDVIAKRVEPFLHAIPVIFFGATAVAGIAMEVYNPIAIAQCWIGVWPINCLEDPDIECERGEEYAAFFAFWLVIVPLLGILFFILVCLFMVIWTVCSWQRYHHQNNSSGLAAMVAARKSRLHTVQCILYGTSFVNTLLWGSVDILSVMAGNPRDFWVLALGVFFLPLQGFFSFIIFIRPRYLRKRQDQQINISSSASGGAGGSRWHALYEAVWNPSSSPTRAHDPNSTERARYRQSNDPTQTGESNTLRITLQEENISTNS